MNRTWSVACAAMALMLVGTVQSFAAGGAEVGKPAPQFTATDTQGKTYDLSALTKEGKIVVLEWYNPDCPFVRRHYDAGVMNTLAGKYADKDVVWLSISSTHNMSAADVTKASAKWQLNHPILMDQDGKIGHLYGAATTPDMFIINKDGIVAYRGAIDNDPRGDKGTDAVNYVDKALTEMLAGQSVSTAETRPYGCSVKYGKAQANAQQNLPAVACGCDGGTTEKPKEKDKSAT